MWYRIVVDCVSDRVKVKYLSVGGRIHNTNSLSGFRYRSPNHSDKDKLVLQRNTSRKT